MDSNKLCYVCGKNIADESDSPFYRCTSCLMLIPKYGAQSIRIEVVEDDEWEEGTD
jgi:hypothetical protein